MKLTAKEIAEVLAILTMIEKASVQQFRDPVFVGSLQAQAFIKLWPLQNALDKLNVEIEA
jgi:hypothetical protein